MRTFDYASFETIPTPGEVKLYLSLIKEYKGKLQDIYVRKPDTLNKMIHFAAQRSAGASNRMEGIATTDKRLPDLLDGEIRPESIAEKEILGYKYCMDLIRKNQDSFTFTPADILQLHEHLYRYNPSRESGHFKNDDILDEQMREECGIPENDRAPCTKTIHFVPSSALDTPLAMQNLCDAYNRAMEKNAVSSLVLSFQFVLDFLCISPFHEGNGRMSRLLMHLLLYQNDYKAGKCISLEEMMERTRSSYCEALRQSTENWQEGTNNPWPFICYMLGIILSAYRELENRFV